MALLAQIPGVSVAEVRTKEELAGVAGLIIPGRRGQGKDKICWAAIACKSSSTQQASKQAGREYYKLLASLLVRQRGRGAHQVSSTSVYVIGKNNIGLRHRRLWPVRSGRGAHQGGAGWSGRPHHPRWGL
jgi:hypothetical protein